MLKLENISTYDFICNLSLIYDANTHAIVLALTQYQISNYQELERFILAKPVKNINYNYLEWHLNNIKRKIALKEDTIPQILYNPNDIIDIYTDEQTKGDKLPIKNPFSKYHHKMYQLYLLSIKDIKTLLAHTTLSGENALTLLKNIGNAYKNKIYSDILFYDEQIKRQKKEADEMTSNLFTFNYDYKIEELILGDEPLEISLEYILDVASEMIWGPLTNANRRKLESIIKQIKNGNYQDNTYQIILDTIANYVTLKEAQEGLVRTRAINRFITKEKQSND